MNYGNLAAAIGGLVTAIIFAPFMMRGCRWLAKRSCERQRKLEETSENTEL
jgi:hypothetical protein